MAARTKELRAAVPEAERIVEEVAPRLLEVNHESRLDGVPAEWRELVDQLRVKVHADHEKWQADFPDDEREVTREERLGYHWSFAIGRVDDMVEYLMREIRRDIGVEDGATLASMLLVRQALLHLNIELQCARGSDARDDEEERRYRVYGALRALMPKFDDVHLRRFRAVAVARLSTRWTRLPSESDVAASMEALREEDDDAAALEKRHRWLWSDRPAMDGVIARQWLAEVDRRFRELDPLVVLEEFAAAEASGGRSTGGDGKTGPVRAVARLALMCGALEFEQRADEDFDAAVDRAVGNLHVTCSRIRKALREFPGLRPEEAL